MGNILDCSSDPLDQIQEDAIEDHPEERGGSAQPSRSPLSTGARGNGEPIPRINTTEPRSGRPASTKKYLERDIPLRDSQLWRLQREFYMIHGVSCWQSLQVPCFVTSNSFIASSLARVAIAFLRDWFMNPSIQNANRSEPMYMIELGTGHGKFSFLFLQALLESKEFIPRLANGEALAFVYVVTDIAQDSLDFVASHPEMQDFVKMGLLDVAILDAEDPTAGGEVTLQLRKATIDLDSLSNPVVTICNYVFDSLLLDAFKYDAGLLYESLVSVSTLVEEERGAPTGKTNPRSRVPSMSDMQVQWKRSEESIDAEEARFFYGLPPEGAARGHPLDKDFNPILAGYLEDSEVEKAFSAGGGSILMPLGALRLLRRMRSWGQGRALALVGDKGYSLPQEMKGTRDPHVAVHGSFSCMVNLDALSRYTTGCGGHAINSPYQEGFKCQALLFGMKEEEASDMVLAWQEAFDSFGPESFTALQRAVKEEVPQPTLRLVHALLRLSNLDPDVFFKFKSVLVSRMSQGDVPPSTLEDFRRDILGMSKRLYQLHPAKDVLFEAARLLMAIKDFQGALKLFVASENACGAHYVTHHNKGMCYFYLGQLQPALDAFDSCLKIQPDYDDAKHWSAHAKKVLYTTTSESS